MKAGFYFDTFVIDCKRLSEAIFVFMEGIHISLAAEKLGSFMGVPITNTLIMVWVVSAILIVCAVVFGRKLSMVPGRFQVLLEVGIGGGMSYIEDTLESKRLARLFFALIASLFIFILVGNLIQFVPGVGSIGFYSMEKDHLVFAPLFRGLATDLNVTLALATIAFLTIEITGFRELGFLKYAGKFVNFKSPLSFAIGIIDLFSEFARLISFSFRLFGNIFAGEVIILIIIAFVPYILPVPLILFEVFVGFIQAAIFALLTLFFIKIAVTEHH